VVAAGIVVLLAVAVVQHDALLHPPPGTWVLLGLLVLGDFLVLLPRNGQRGERSVAVLFAFALLFGPAAPFAALGRVGSSVASEIARRKPVHKILFNAGQYGVGWGLAALVFGALADPGDPVRAVPAGAIVAAGATFFLCSSSLVGIRVAMDRGRQALPALRRGFWSAAMHTVGWVGVGALIAAAGVAWTSIPVLMLPLVVFLGGRDDIAQLTNAMRDPLTGLPNRALFLDRAEQAIRAAARTGGRGAVLLLDLNGFKAINDTRGHKAGDELLVEVASRLCTRVRASDTVARLGGDEFSVLLNGDADTEDSARIARDLQAAIEKPIVIDGHPCRVSASVGRAHYPADGTDVSALLELADHGMYADKRADTLSPAAH
jgi:diguanylate cyclase (GGDEF)-like protein